MKNWSKKKKIIVGIIVLIVIGIGSNQSVKTSSSIENSDPNSETKSLNINGIYKYEGSNNESAQFIVNGNQITGYYGYGIGDRTYLENSNSISHYINDSNQIIFNDKTFNRIIVKGEITDNGVLKYQSENGLITSKK